jgi:hypothetical protein
MIVFYFLQFIHVIALLVKITELVKMLKIPSSALVQNIMKELLVKAEVGLLTFLY